MFIALLPRSTLLSDNLLICLFFAPMIWGVFFKKQKPKNQNKLKKPHTNKKKPNKTNDDNNNRKTKKQPNKKKQPTSKSLEHD